MPEEVVPDPSNGPDGLSAGAPKEAPATSFGSLPYDYLDEPQAPQPPPPPPYGGYQAPPQQGAGYGAPGSYQGAPQGGYSNPSYGPPSYGPPGYGPPSYGSGGYGRGNPLGSKPSNYLVWAIISTVLCCIPLGIVSIIFAAQVDGRWNAGDVVGALDSSKKAKLFAILATTIGLVVIVIYGVMFGLAAHSGSSPTYPTSGV